jgi:hypothetical protein
MSEGDAHVTGVSAALTPQERLAAVVYLDTTPREPGRTSIGGREIDVDRPYYLAFIDGKPGANWMHPCRYLLIDRTGRAMASVESDRPPAFGALPAGWRVVLRPPDVEDWTLLRTDDPSRSPTPERKD